MIIELYTVRTLSRSHLGMNKKQRISHFTTKAIEINESTRPQPFTTNVVLRKSPKHRTKRNQNQLPKRVVGIKLQRILLQKEADYATVPKRQDSEIVKKIIDKEVADFRAIK